MVLVLYLMVEVSRFFLSCCSGSLQPCLLSAKVPISYHVSTAGRSSSEVEERTQVPSFSPNVKSFYTCDHLHHHYHHLVRAFHPNLPIPRGGWFNEALYPAFLMCCQSLKLHRDREQNRTKAEHRRTLMVSNDATGDRMSPSLQLKTASAVIAKLLSSGSIWWLHIWMHGKVHRVLRHKLASPSGSWGWTRLHSCVFLSLKLAVNDLRMWIKKASRVSSRLSQNND